MFKRALAASVAAAALFGAGFWFGRVKSVQAFAESRVFELRTYTANEGKFDDLQKRFRDHTVRIFQKHGMQNIGYWSPVDAPLSGNTLIYLLGHANREAAKKSWDAFRSDPEWKTAQQASETGGRLVSKVESIYLTPTDYSPMK